jgi:hypothetical protein
MRRRRVPIIALLFGVVLVAVCAHEWHIGASITAANVDRIQAGMTFEEVVSILRSPPSNARGTTWQEIRATTFTPIDLAKSSHQLTWEGGGGFALVFFDDRGQVYGKGYYELTGLDGLRFRWIRLFGTRPPF